MWNLTTLGCNVLQVNVSIGISKSYHEVYGPTFWGAYGNGGGHHKAHTQAYIVFLIWRILKYRKQLTMSPKKMPNSAPAIRDS